MSTAFETYMEREMGARAPFLIGEIAPNTSIDPVVTSAPDGVFYRMTLPADHHTIWFKEGENWIELLRKDDLPEPTDTGISVVEVASEYAIMPTDTHLLVDSSTSIVEIELVDPPVVGFREIFIRPSNYLYQIKIWVTNPLTQTIRNGFSEPDTEIFISSPGEIIHLIGHGDIWEVW